jgi:hypothetical protein
VGRRVFRRSDGLRRRLKRKLHHRLTGRDLFAALVLHHDVDQHSARIQRGLLRFHDSCRLDGVARLAASALSTRQTHRLAAHREFTAVKNGLRDPEMRLPHCPRKRTQRGHRGMSPTCQQPTSVFLLPVNRCCSRSRRVLLSRSSEQASQVTYILQVFEAIDH